MVSLIRSAEALRHPKGEAHVARPKPSPPAGCLFFPAPPLAKAARSGAPVGNRGAPAKLKESADRNVRATGLMSRSGFIETIGEVVDVYGRGRIGENEGLDGVRAGFYIAGALYKRSEKIRTI